MTDPRVEALTVPVRAIGVGNSYRCDDGVGIWIVRRLGALGLAGLETLERSGEGTELMSAWEGAGSVLLFDAVSSGAPPGSIHRIDARRDSVPTDFFHYSTHAFSVAEAVELARQLGMLPPRLLLYGIEGACFAAGEEIGEQVRAAAEIVLEEVKAMLAAPQVAEASKAGNRKD